MPFKYLNVLVFLLVTVPGGISRNGETPVQVSLQYISCQCLLTCQSRPRILLNLNLVVEHYVLITLFSFNCTFFFHRPPCLQNTVLCNLHLNGTASSPRSVDLSLDEWNDFPWDTCLFTIVVYVRNWKRPGKKFKRALSMHHLGQRAVLSSRKPSNACKQKHLMARSCWKMLSLTALCCMSFELVNFFV